MCASQLDTTYVSLVRDSVFGMVLVAGYVIIFYPCASACVRVRVSLHRYCDAISLLSPFVAFVKLVLSVSMPLVQGGVIFSDRYVDVVMRPVGKFWSCSCSVGCSILGDASLASRPENKEGRVKTGETDRWFLRFWPRVMSCSGGPALIHCSPPSCH